MAISVDWPTGVISVPQADLALVSGTLYDFDTDAFRLNLKTLEASVAGMPWLRTHKHNTEVPLVGIVYARALEIINGYSITFEDTGSAYTVRFIGSNNNFFDVDGGVLNPTALVTYVPGNAAGLIVTSQSGLTPDELTLIMDIWTRLFGGRLYVNPATAKEEIFDALGAAYSEADVYSDDGTTPYDGTQGIARRDDHVKP